MITPPREIDRGIADGSTKLLPVGSFPPNAWGLHDMHGNVWEWCRDGYDVKLPGGVDPEGPGGALRRVVRGGSWLNFGVNCRSADRGRGNPGYRVNFLGFRVAAVPLGAKDK